MTPDAPYEGPVPGTWFQKSDVARARKKVCNAIQTQIDKRLGGVEASAQLLCGDGLTGLQRILRT